MANEPNALVDGQEVIEVTDATSGNSVISLNVSSDGQVLSSGIYDDDYAPDSLIEVSANVTDDVDISEYRYSSETNTISHDDDITHNDDSIPTLESPLIRQILLAAHPVGSYYWSSEGTDPSILFGGTWTRITNRFVFAASDKYVVGQTGGAETVTLTTSQIPSHAHTVHLWVNAGTLGTNKYASSDGGSFYTGEAGHQPPYGSWNSSSFNCAQSGYGDQSGVTSMNGGGGSHNNMPPYIVAYCWRRTA
jgi:hypothetical protein